MSTTNGKLITSLTDETERIEKVEKKVNSVVVSLTELIEYSNQESVRFKKVEHSLAKVSDLGNRLQAVEFKQQKSGIKLLLGMNFLTILIVIGSFAGNFFQLNPEVINDWKTGIENLQDVQQK